MTDNVIPMNPKKRAIDITNASDYIIILVDEDSEETIYMYSPDSETRVLYGLLEEAKDVIRSVKPVQVEDRD